MIDPKKELSIYGYNIATNDREYLLEFVNQLVDSNTDRREISSQDEQFHRDVDDEHIEISADHLSIMEKTIKQKFDGLLGFRTGIDILRKAKQSRNENIHSIIR